MSDERQDPTEPIAPREATVPLRRTSSRWLGNAMAILLVLAVGTAVIGGAVRSLRPISGGATAPGASALPGPTDTASFTPRPLPSFTPTPTPSPTPTASPSPTRRPTPTPRATRTPPPPRTPTPAPPRTPTPTPAR